MGTNRPVRGPAAPCVLLGPVATEAVVARNPVAVEHCAAERRLTGQDGCRADLRELPNLALAVAPENLQGLPLGRQPRAAAVCGNDERGQRHGPVVVAGVEQLGVGDAGVGLPPESVDSVFQPFYSTKSGGMGIGLFVSRSIIEQHHGRLWVERNNDGPGATFSFSIPASPESVATPTHG